jgi:hypothetical protein
MYVIYLTALPTGEGSNAEGNMSTAKFLEEKHSGEKWAEYE